MHVEPDEKEKLLKGYRMVLIIWGAILASLPFYYFVCTAVGDQVQSNIGADAFTVVRQTLWGLSILTLMAVHFLRNILLKKGGVQSRSLDAASISHPVVARYTVTIVITTAMLESIGIYGVVLFFLGRDSGSLLLLLLISAIGMLVYRPKKEELFRLATGKFPQN